MTAQKKRRTERGIALRFLAPSLYSPFPLKGAWSQDNGVGGEDEWRVPIARLLSKIVVLCVVYPLPPTPLLVCVLKVRRTTRRFFMRRLWKLTKWSSKVPFWCNWNNGMITKTQVNSSLSLATETFSSDVWKVNYFTLTIIPHIVPFWQALISQIIPFLICHN